MKPAWLMSVVRVDKHDTGLFRRRLCGHGGKATDESQCGACTALSCEELRKIVQRQKHLSHLLVVCGGNVGSFGPHWLGAGRGFVPCLISSGEYARLDEGDSEMEVCYRGARGEAGAGRLLRELMLAFKPEQYECPYEVYEQMMGVRNELWRWETFFGRFMDPLVEAETIDFEGSFEGEDGERVQNEDFCPYESFCKLVPVVNFELAAVEGRERGVEVWSFEGKYMPFLLIGRRLEDGWFMGLDIH